MDSVLWKNGVKCAVFKISDVFSKNQMINYISTSDILKLVFLTHKLLAGREHKMDIVLSKNGVKCAEIFVNQRS